MIKVREKKSVEEDTVKKAIVDFAVVCYLLLKVKL